MNFLNPNEQRQKLQGKRLKKPSRLLLSNQHHAYQQPAPWTQSSVSLITPQANNFYAQPTHPPQPPVYSLPQPQSQPQPQPQPQYQPYRPVIQQHNWASTTNLPIQQSLSEPVSQDLNERDVIGDKISEIISLIDEDAYSEAGQEIVISLPPQTPPPSYSQSRTLPPGHGENERRLVLSNKPGNNSQQIQSRNINVRAKLSYYSNSRLPASLPPFHVYLPTYPLLCLAALCSANAYHYRQNAVRNEQLIAADSRIGSKAMVVKSVTCADEKTLVFAIRGTSVLNLRDWNVNLNTTPESPAGFLDDEGNYCHSGFLRVAKAMIKPIATHLKRLLEENPGRLGYSLLITGHSAGGAVASLLYAHMMSEHVKSELTALAGCFKRVHCVTFGAPPISLLPLQKPANKAHKLQKCLFHSFINEGDPVVRAEKSYIMSLVDLLTTTPSSASSLLPSTGSKLTPFGNHMPRIPSAPMSALKITNLGIFTGPKKDRIRHNSAPQTTRSQQISSRIWKVPPGTLSNAGRLVILRGPEPPSKEFMSQVDLTKEFEEVRAYTATDEEIRKVIFGDPLMHAMEVYRRRIEALAMKAATGRDRYYR